MSTDLSTGSPVSEHVAADRSGVPADLRRGWRRLLAVLAPLPMLGMGVGYLLSPLPGDAPFADLVAAADTHRPTTELIAWLSLPFLVLLVPATGALIAVTRRAAPRLTTAGGLLAVLGFCAGFALLPGDTTLARLTAQGGLPVEIVAALDRAWWELPAVAAASLLFILGETVGLSLLGLALWRSRRAPRWMSVALVLGALTHPFLPNQLAAGAGLIVAAVGFAGAGVALLRMTDDEFDLPPRSPVRVRRTPGPSTRRPGPPHA